MSSFNDGYKILASQVIENGNKIISDTVIISTGAQAKWLGIENENKYKGFYPKSKEYFLIEFDQNDLNFLKN